MSYIEQVKKLAEMMKAEPRVQDAYFSFGAGMDTKRKVHSPGLFVQGTGRLSRFYTFRQFDDGYHIRAYDVQRRKGMPPVDEWPAMFDVELVGRDLRETILEDWSMRE